MEWPAQCQVPSYFVRGMTFESMLDAHKQLFRKQGDPASDPLEMVDDDESLNGRPIRRFGIKKVNESGIRKKHGTILRPRSSVTSPRPSSSYSSRRPPAASVWVRNIPYSVTDSDLRDHFSHLGGIIFARVDRESGKSMGTGTVVFQTTKEALCAVDTMQNSCMGDRHIKVALKGG